MRGHDLMQAIARVNRVYRDKEGGLVVDYVGLARALKDAMSEYTKRDQENFGDMDIAKEASDRFHDNLQICRDKVHGLDYSKFFGSSDLDKAEAIKDFYADKPNELMELTRELTDELRRSRTIDWSVKQSARAEMRRKVKRLLKKYKYPPEGQEDALATVIAQCEMWVDDTNERISETA